MKRIKITEAQAKALGLIKTSEKKKLKITNEQFKRIFGNKLLGENSLIGDEFNTEDKGLENNEIEELIKVIYGQSKDLSPFWSEKCITLDEICGFLIRKKLIMQDGDNFKLTRNNQTEPSQAIENLKSNLNELVQSKKTTNTTGSEELDEVESSDEPSNEPSDIVYNVIACNDNIVIFEGSNGIKYLFYIDDDLKNNEIFKSYMGGGNDTLCKTVDNFVAANTHLLKIGRDLIEITEEIKDKLHQLYYYDDNILKALDIKPNINTKKDVVNSLKRNFSQELEEMTSLGGSGGVFQSSGVNNFPVGKASGENIIKRESIVRESIKKKLRESTSDIPTYDTPGGLTMDLGKHNPKTKAEKTPQWAGGSFVKQPECSKLNNNKEAQNGGCNQGASTLKTVKTGGSINAPSLGENKIIKKLKIFGENNSQKPKL